MYDFLKAFHVLSVTLLAAGIGVETATGPLLGRATSTQQLKLLLRIGQNAERFAILPALLLIPVFGYATAAKGSWSLGMTWLVIGQVFFFLAAGISTGYLARNAAGLEKATHDLPDGPIPEDIQRIASDPRPGMASALLLVFFIIIVLAMVTKPGY